MHSPPQLRAEFAALNGPVGVRPKKLRDEQKKRQEDEGQRPGKIGDDRQDGARNHNSDKTRSNSMGEKQLHFHICRYQADEISERRRYR